MEDYDDYDNNDDVGCGLIGGKWDGQSPFGTDTAAPTKNKPTLTEEELLTRYQTMYDDEEINYDLTLALVRYVNQSSYGDGAILIFFSGWTDISEFLMILESTPPFNNRSQFVLYPLHSGIPSKEQRQVFLKPPKGMRKIILATNLAETSLTIEDVAFVIDTGRSKEKSYDPHLKTSTLQESWISQASAKQRKGRAGRCKAGVCFHLFSRRRHASMRPFVESELIRTPLEEICLQCKQLKLAPGGPDEPDGIPDGWLHRVLPARAGMARSARLGAGSWTCVLPARAGMARTLNMLPPVAMGRSPRTRGDGPDKTSLPDG